MLFLSPFISGINLIVFSLLILFELRQEVIVKGMFSMDKKFVTLSFIWFDVQILRLDAYLSSKELVLESYGIFRRIFRFGKTKVTKSIERKLQQNEKSKKIKPQQNETSTKIKPEQIYTFMRLLKKYIEVDEVNLIGNLGFDSSISTAIISTLLNTFLFGVSNVKSNVVVKPCWNENVGECAFFLALRIDAKIFFELHTLNSNKGDKHGKT